VSFIKMKKLLKKQKEIEEKIADYERTLVLYMGKIRKIRKRRMYYAKKIEAEMDIHSKKPAVTKRVVHV
jgi:ABC-type Fe3+-citrate transport system substrate-binding protein